MLHTCPRLYFLPTEFNSSCNHSPTLSHPHAHTWYKIRTQMNRLCYWPLAHSYSPGCDDPQGDAEDQQHRPGADSHEGFHYKPCVKMHLWDTHTHVSRWTQYSRADKWHCVVQYIEGLFLRSPGSSSCTSFPTQTCEDMISLISLLSSFWQRQHSENLHCNWSLDRGSPFHLGQALQCLWALDPFQCGFFIRSSFVINFWQTDDLKAEPEPWKG